MNKEQIKKISDKQFGVRPIANIELQPLLKREDIHSRLSDCIIEMITSYNLPYYGEFTQFINFWEAKIQTCGVNVTSKGMNFYWDRDWIESRTRKELIFTIIHEVFHLLFDHQKRGIGYDKKIANLAADMIINSIIHGDLMISEGLDKMIEIPKDSKGNNVVVFIDKKYKGPLIFEDVYAWLVNEYNEWKNKNSHKLNKKNNVSVDKDGNITIDGKKYCGKCGQEMSDDKEESDSKDDKKSEKQPQSDNEGDQSDNEGANEGANEGVNDGDNGQEIPSDAGKCGKCGQEMSDDKEESDSKDDKKSEKQPQSDNEGDQSDNEGANEGANEGVNDGDNGQEIPSDAGKCGKCGQEMSDDKEESDSKDDKKSEKQPQSDNEGDQSDNEGANEGANEGVNDGDNGQEIPSDAGKCGKCGQEIPQGSQGDSPGQGDGQGDGDGQDDSPGYGENGTSGDNGKNKVGMYPIEQFFENIESNKGQSFDIHFDDDVPEAARKQFVESTMEKLKSRGLTSANIEKVLNKLRKSEKDYLKEIKRSLSNDIFGSYKQKSITKLNRRGIWGLKGTRKYKTVINCLLDTSGSMNGSFERVLSYIFQNDISINLLQCDTEVKNFIRIDHKNELEKMTINGLGGTILQTGLDYVKDDKELRKYPLVILTDGYCDTLNFSGLKKNVLILSTGVNCPTVPGTNSNSIKIKQIIIDNERKQ